MSENFFATDVGDVLSEALPDQSDDVYVVNPTQESIPDVVFGLYDETDPPPVSVLADADILKDVLADYVVAGHAADLVAAGTLSVRELDEAPEASLLVAEDLVVSLVEVPDHVGGLAATEAPFVDEALDHYADRWARADRFTLRAPPISRVRETLAADVGTAAADDFDAVLDALPAVKNEGEGLDEVTVALLVAARHGVLLYDISRWGEEVGLASKATFSRKKGILEDAGVITTEKVPIDVGRPRLRLRLATDRLRTSDISELTTLVREQLAAPGVA